MARKQIARDQIVKLIVGAGQASPSPPVGPALGSKGVKSIDFCKVGESLSINVPPKSDNRAGVQRTHSSHDTRGSYTCSSHRSPGPFFSLRTPNTNHILSPAPSRRGEGAQEQASWRWCCRQRKRWGSFVEAYLRYRQDQTIRAPSLRPFTRRSMQKRHCSGKVLRDHGRTLKDTGGAPGIDHIYEIATQVLLAQ